MFKQIVVLVIMGVALLSSNVLWAQGGQESVKVAMHLDIENQLSISAHQGGEESFIQQVRAHKVFPKKAQSKQGVPISLLSGLGVMVFGLMYFVLRSSRRRIK